MAKAKLPRFRSLVDLRASLPPATVGRGGSKGKGEGLMLMVPPETMDALRARAAAERTTTRALVLEALRKSGFPVPTGELIDRRRKA
jgi:hypothetical protein